MEHQETETTKNASDRYLNPYWITVVALVALGIINVCIIGEWLDPFTLIPPTVAVIMTLGYFLLLNLAESDTILTSGNTETFGLSENNGALVEVILFSDQYHTRTDEDEKKEGLQDWNKWDILPGPYSKSWLEEEMNARWMGMWWNRELASVVLHCHEWKDKKSPIASGTREKRDHVFDRYIPLFHTHAYITDTIEIKGNFHVKGAFTFRFRIVNPYLAFYQTSNVIFMLDAIAKDVTREIWGKKTFDQLKLAKFATLVNTGEIDVEKLKPKEKRQMGYALMIGMNAELEKYGIAVVDIHFVDLLDTEQDERDALKAMEMAEREGQAGVKKAELAAKAFELETTALVRREKELVKAVYDGNNGDAAAMTAYALTKAPDLKAYGTGAMVDAREKAKKPETTDKP